MQSQKDSFSLEPIGHILTVFANKFGTPRQGALAPNSRAEFELMSTWRKKGAFAGLEGFSHVWLLSYFHHNKHTRAPSKVHPPRLLGKSVGVFASRSPHRPNSLGLTLARLVKVEGDKLWLSGVDLVSGTPIFDIKPYLAEADRPDYYSCGWAEQLEPTQVACQFSAHAEKELLDQVKAGRIVDHEQFKALVREVLSLDPRPLSYRERINERFAIVLAGMDVHARHNEGQFTVESVQPYISI